MIYHTQVEWIALPALAVIWPEAQRRSRPARIAEIQKFFDPDALDMPHVSPPIPEAGGLHHIIDGNNRAIATRKALGEDQQLECIVHLDATHKARCAELFLMLNDSRSRPTAHETFRARVTANDPGALEIKRIIEETGYTTTHGVKNSINAIQTCYVVFRRFGAGRLRTTLALLADMWPGQSAAVEAAMIQGFAEFLSKHGGNPNDIRARLPKKFRQPEVFLDRAKGLRTFIPSGKMADAIVLALAVTIMGIDPLTGIKGGA